MSSITPKGVADLKTKPVGTGPFVFESYEPNQQFTLKANPNYYEDRPALPGLGGLQVLQGPGFHHLGAALQGHRHDLVQGPEGLGADHVKTSPDLVSAPGKTSRTFPVWLNQKAKPFNDVKRAPRAEPGHRPQGLPA